MEELRKALEAVLADEPGRLVLSAPRPGGQWRRGSVAPVGAGWQAELRTDTQAFHRNLAAGELPEALEGWLTEGFFQLTAFGQKRTHALRVSKKGRVLTTTGPPQAAPGEVVPPSAARPHDRQKARVLAEGVAIPPLADIGVLTAEGRPVAAMRDKWRQINRFVELVDDAVRAGTLPPPEAGPLRVVDFGCGKSYLSFVLYHYLTALKGYTVEMTGLDLKADVIAGCNAAAEKYGYEGLRFEVGDIASYAGAGAHLVVTLHACDTATDLALAQAVGWGAGCIFSVPCCQHELNAQMESDALALLTRYGIVKERTAALMTDAVRANLLAACGYKAQLVEFVDFEHTPKNIMIRAVKAGQPAARRREMLEEVRRLCDAFSLKPTLLRLLEEQGALPE